MNKTTQKQVSADDVALIITSELKKVSGLSGRGLHVVMDDYISLLLIFYRALPRQIHWMYTYGTLSADDAPYNKALISDIESEYGKYYPILKSAITNYIVAGDRCGWANNGVLFHKKDQNWDMLGQIYELFNLTNKATDMYFTPWHVCRFMAQLTGRSTEEMPDMFLTQELSRYMSGAVSPQEIQNELLKPFISKELYQWVTEASKNGFKPIVITDPCAGTGRLSLAESSLHSKLAEDLGLYTYQLIELDGRACKIAEINQLKFAVGGWKRTQWSLSIAGFYETSRWMKYESIENSNGRPQLTEEDLAWVNKKTKLKLNISHLLW